MDISPPPPPTASPKISVVIPTYNHAAYILETLDSVFAQSCRDYEIIVINDGSPDNTSEVLRPLAEAGRIRYIEQPNAGQGEARNRGLREARGEFIALLDDDDLWPPDKLEWQLAALSQAGPQAVASAGQCEFIGDVSLSRPEVRLVEPLQLSQLLLANAIVSPGQALIRKSALQAISGFRNIRGGADDWDCWIRLAKHGNIVVSQRTALRYRLHPTNASRNAIHMLDSARRVAVEHTNAATTPTRATAIKSLLECAGLPVAHQTIRALGRGDAKGALAGFRCLKDCVASSGYDLKCAGLVAASLAHACQAGVRAKLRKAAALAPGKRLAQAPPTNV